MVAIVALGLVLVVRLGGWDAALGAMPPAVASKVPAALGSRALLPSSAMTTVRASTPYEPQARPLRGVSVLTLSFAGLQPLASGHYEGWAIFASGALSTGTFTVSPEGALIALNGDPLRAFPLTRDILSAERIAITIEPDGDRDPAPSPTTILEGALVRGHANLAFPVDLRGLEGGYSLLSPTDDRATNDAAGLWFYDGSTRQAALRLPELPAGWLYEGWVGSQELAFSTGRFARIVGPDLAAPFSGPRAGLAVPGEDLVARLPATLRQPVNLADGASTVAISLEPDFAGQDPTGPGPFWLLLLSGAIPREAPPATLLPLELDASVLPSGVATVG